MRFLPFSASSSDASASRTANPPWAATCAMPPPIWPAPRMPIVWISATPDMVRSAYHARAGLAFAIAVGSFVPACAPSATESAMSLVRQHRDEEAIATLRERLAKQPEDVEARRLLVRILAAA